MSAKLPVIVGFGGFNAAGRCSGHQAFRRMILESLSASERRATLAGIANLMGVPEQDADAVIAGTLVRKIEPSYFDPQRVRTTKVCHLLGTEDEPAHFVMARRQLPAELPPDWQVAPIDERGRLCRITVNKQIDVKIDTHEAIAVKAAGQLPSGFDPASYYRSQHHPRGLQMAILGASDAVQSIGIPWRDIAGMLPPDKVSVYSASIMSQLDENGFGGMFGGRSLGKRVTSKQLALGFNTMPADFINAYVLGSLGATAGVAGACATFLYNLRAGVEDIRSGRRLVSIVGASEAPILPEVIDGYAAMSALATDAELAKLDGVDIPNYRRASRPFGHNCGFTLSESSQYVVLMAEELALELGARIYGAVPAVYVNADGYKKSISAPGPGNYVTMAKAVGLTRTLLGEEAVSQRSAIQAHGSSTPQNRTTESKIFDRVAAAFGISDWPVVAVKAYLGHSLAAASGDQLVNSLGIFEYGILPGIKTHTHIADDVHGDRLHIALDDREFAKGTLDAIFLNSKGFGGNNATASVFSPEVVSRYMQKHHGTRVWSRYQKSLAKTKASHDQYIAQADAGNLNPIYEFGTQLIEEDKISLSPEALQIPGYREAIPLAINEDFEEF